MAYARKWEYSSINPSLSDPDLTRSMALHALHRLQMELAFASPGHHHRAWLEQKIRYYQTLLSTDDNGNGVDSTD